MHHHHPRRMAAGFLLVAALLFVVLFAASHVDAGVGGSHRHQGDVGAARVREVWQTKVSNRAINAPYFDSATNWLYVNSVGNFSILNANSGSLIKNLKTNSANGFSDVVPVGATKVCTNEYNSTVCRHKTTLATVWKFETSGDFENTPLYVSSKNAMYVVNQGTSNIYKLSAEDGALEASLDLPPSNFYYQHLSFSKKYNLVFAGGANFFAALNADTLVLAWKYATDELVQNSGTLSEDESMIYFPSDNGACFALHTPSGKLIWRAPVGASNTPSLHNGVLYVGSSNGNSYALNGATGKQIWNVPTNSNVVNPGHSYIYGDTVLFPNGGIVAVALNGSGVAWNWATASVYSFPAPTADGKLFVGGNSGNIYALQLPPASNINKGVVEKRCLDTACSSGCQVNDFSAGNCIQTGPTSSVLRTCSSDGTLLSVRSFASNACSTSSSHTTTDYAVGKCYVLSFGGSIEVTKCTA